MAKKTKPYSTEIIRLGRGVSKVRFTVGPQTFTLEGWYTVAEARYFERMLKIALDRLVAHANPT